MCRTYNREGQDKSVNVVPWHVYYWYSSKVVRLSRHVELNIFWFSLAPCCGVSWARGVGIEENPLWQARMGPCHFCIKCNGIDASFTAAAVSATFTTAIYHDAWLYERSLISTNILAEIHIPVESGLWTRSAAFWLYLFCNLDGSSFNETPLESLDFLQAEIRTV